VGQAASQFSYQIRSCGSNCQKIVPPCYLDVLDRVFNGEKIREYFLTGQGGEGERLDELFGRCGHDYLNRMAPFPEQAYNVGRLVGCDPAAYTQKYFHAITE